MTYTGHPSQQKMSPCPVCGMRAVMKDDRIRWHSPLRRVKNTPWCPASGMAVKGQRLVLREGNE